MFLDLNHIVSQINSDTDNTMINGLFSFISSDLAIEEIEVEDETTQH